MSAILDALARALRDLFNLRVLWVVIWPMLVAAARASGGSLVGNLWNALVALLLFIALWGVTLPLWLMGVGVLVPFIAAAYLNQRLFRYDALAEHASADEMAALFKSERGGWWGLGLLTGLLQFVPLLNLLGPVFAALAFIHYGLARLRQQRDASVA
ncbi:MAG: hypothetical protein B7X81_02995 [Hydrogenophilales bacterium 17-61-76]|nr:MAG: hypothetical protein B7X81_02995 [Hydrogenophilales bacterium 17-61-76]